MSPRARKPPQRTNTPAPDDAATATLAQPAGLSQASAESSGQSRAERIAQRAYAIYERRGGQDGSPTDDWLQAEREIDNEA